MFQVQVLLVSLKLSDLFCICVYVSNKAAYVSKYGRGIFIEK
jgi:hypothetical protein